MRSTETSRIAQPADEVTLATSVSTAVMVPVDLAAVCSNDSNTGSGEGGTAGSTKAGSGALSGHLVLMSVRRGCGARRSSHEHGSKNSSLFHSMLRVDALCNHAPGKRICHVPAPVVNTWGVRVAPSLTMSSIYPLYRHNRLRGDHPQTFSVPSMRGSTSVATAVASSLARICANRRDHINPKKHISFGIASIENCPSHIIAGGALIMMICFFFYGDIGIMMNSHAPPPPPTHEPVFPWAAAV